MQNDINIPEDVWLLLYTQRAPRATAVAKNTIDFDQTEYGGTVNFLLISE